MAVSICKLSEIVTSDEAASYLVPMVSILLKNNSTEVIVSLIENLQPLISVLPMSSLNEKLIPALVNLAQDKTWRIRYAAINFFPKLGEYLDRDTMQQKIEPTIAAMLTDPVFTIREQTAVTLIALSQKVFDQAWLERLIESRLEELVSNERFMLRIQTIHCINQMKDHVSH